MKCDLEYRINLCHIYEGAKPKEKLVHNEINIDLANWPCYLGLCKKYTNYFETCWISLCISLNCLSLLFLLLFLLFFKSLLSFSLLLFFFLFFLSFFWLLLLLLIILSLLSSSLSLSLISSHFPYYQCRDYDSKNDYQHNPHLLLSSSLSSSFSSS